MFANLQSTYLQEQAIRDSPSYVAPKEIFLGLVEEQTETEQGIKSTLKQETMMYIPIKESLQELIGKNLIADHLKFPPKTINEDGYFYDIPDGSFIKMQYNAKFQMNSKVFHIILFHDAVELCNPLGSNRGYHKIVNIYYTLVNIPPKIRSRLDSMRLLAMINSNYLHKYGYKTVLQPFIDDLKQYSEGGYYEFRQNELSIKTSITLCTGDTEGQHQIGGFKVGVNFAEKKCRQCFITSDELQENPNKICTHRSEELHKEQLCALENAGNILTVCRLR